MAMNATLQLGLGIIWRHILGKVNRNFKASVFTHLFAEPDNERGLYNAFSSVALPPDTPVVDLTLTDILYKDRVNDLAFSVGDRLVCFFEAQSTLNSNMALRYFIYGGRVYAKLINNDELYSESRLIVPTPEFYVLYNGIRPFPDRETYRLSDSFAIAPDSEKPLELVVTAYNINPGHNEDIVRKDDNLYGYVVFTAKARKFEQSGMDRGSAVKAAAEECIKEGILKRYLEDNATEVINMLAQEWDWDKAFEINARDAVRSANEQWSAIVAEKDAEIAGNKAEIADKDAEIADKNAEIADNKAEIADKDAEIARLRSELKKS